MADEAPACDPEFATVIKAKASLEAEREVAAASRLISKPQSVLQYSCFDDRITELGHAADTIFSDRVSGAPLFSLHPDLILRTPPPPIERGSDPFTPIHLGENGPNPPGEDFTADKLDDVLDQLVREPLQAYMSGFGGGGLCESMETVWNSLRCGDFPASFFVKLDNLPAFSCSANAALVDANLALLNPPPATPAAMGGMDALVDYNDKINRDAECGSAVPIPTGVEVQIGGSSHPDAVCSIPGCSYDGSGGCF